MAEKRRRLEVWLPANHPIWALPDRQRAKVVRAVLEAAFGCKVWPGDDLSERLARIEETLSRLEAKLAETGGEEQGERENDLSFDPAAFARTLSNLFG